MKKEISEIWSVDELPDANRVEYKGDLDEYFNEVSKCNWSNQQILILTDMYKEIKKIKESINKDNQNK